MERESGFLICDTCGFTHDHRGYRDPTLGEGWPRHRCSDWKVHAFDRWADEVPLTETERMLSKMRQLLLRD